MPAKAGTTNGLRVFMQFPSKRGTDDGAPRSRVGLVRYFRGAKGDTLTALRSSDTCRYSCRVGDLPPAQERDARR